MLRTLLIVAGAAFLVVAGGVAAVLLTPDRLTLTTGSPEARRAPPPPPPDRTEEVLEEIDTLRATLRAFVAAVDRSQAETDARALVLERRLGAERETLRVVAERLARIEAALRGLRAKAGSASAAAAEVGDAPVSGARGAAAEPSAPAADSEGDAASEEPPTRRSLADLLAARPRVDVRDVATTFRLVPGSVRVGFDGRSTLHDWSAASRKVGGEVRLRLNDLADGAGGRIVLRADSLDSGKEDRDADMVRYLTEGGYPGIACEILAVEPAGPEADGTVRTTARVRFTIHGVSREAAVPVTLAVTRRRLLHVTGEATLLLSDYDVGPVVKVGVLKVEDEVTVWWDLYAEAVHEKR